MRLTKKTITATATWADNHQRSVLLSEIPRDLFVLNTLQSHHLVDLQDMVRQVLYTSFTEEISAY